MTVLKGNDGIPVPIRHTYKGPPAPGHSRAARKSALPSGERRAVLPGCSEPRYLGSALQQGNSNANPSKCASAPGLCVGLWTPPRRSPRQRSLAHWPDESMGMSKWPMPSHQAQIRLPAAITLRGRQPNSVVVYRFQVRLRADTTHRPNSLHLSRSLIGSCPTRTVSHGDSYRLARRHF